MDALTKAALASLEELLPELMERLAPFGLGRGKRAGGEPRELAWLIGEAHELLGVLKTWSEQKPRGGATTPAKPAPGAASEELSDSDALAFLAGDAPATAVADADTDTLRMIAAIDGTATPAAGESDELTDADTLKMLAAMDETATGAAGGDDELTDPETRAMLAAVGGSTPGDATPAAKAAPAPKGAPQSSAIDGEMSDEEARALLAAMDAPAEPAAPAFPSPSADMSDDEARRLLAGMDEPLQPAPAAGGEMSDDEARRLLAAMDEPAPTPAPKGAPAPAATSRPAPSADDEAMAMLASMGGLKDDDGAPVIAAPAAAHASGDDEARGDGDLAEIEEFSKNDFASDPDMMNDFLQNSDDLMETLDQTILQLEQNPRDRETIESIFRAAHTLKGAAGMFGFKAIERVMHRMENLFEKVRKGALVPSAATIDVVFQGLDVLKQLLGAVKTLKPSGVKTVPIVRALELAARGQYVKGSVGGASAGGPPAAAAAAPLQQVAEDKGGGHHDGGGSGGGAGGDGGQKKTEQSTIRVDLERLDMLVNLVGELVIDRTRFVAIEEEIRAFSPQLKVSGNMSETVQLFGRHMNEMHEIVMKIRMVPIGNAFNKFTRVVRDLSRQLGKEISLAIEGEDTELDKTLVEQIGDPLIHLIRNSCDHGVETPEAREAQGKPRGGHIRLGARQEGNNIIITIEDDGKGIQVDAVRKKAIERGLITEEQTLAKRDIFNLIFEPGFSTAEKVTTVSGRGVGMDVVRKQIAKLKGLIDIDSEVGKGTVTTIRLPLTLAIVQSLLIETAGETFAIPLSTVVESVRIKPEEIQFVGESEVIKRHGKVLPLMHLSEILDLDAKEQTSWYSLALEDGEARKSAAAQRAARRRDRLYVVIVGSGERRFGIVVDQLLHQQEMVIKSMGPVMKRVPCVAGGAVLGNGHVVLVLDIHELEEHFRGKGPKKGAA